MSEKRVTMIERVLQRVEDHVEEWRKQDRGRKAELAAHRRELWAEAAERERLLTESVSEEEVRRGSLEDIAKEHRVVFVVHSEEAGRALEDFAGEGDRLLRIVPGRGSYGSDNGTRGSWLVFGMPESRPE